MFLSKLEGRALTAGITITSGVGFTLFGWDQGMFGGILSNPAFIKRFNDPSATIQGQIVSTYDIGCILGAFLSIFVGDRLGRRMSIVMACCFVFVGGLLQCTSYGLPQMIIGRIVAGFGIGQNSATIPMWQSETSKPEHRGKLIALQLVLVIFGITITQFVNLGFTYIPNNEVAFRFPISFQSVLALVTIALVLMMPESPRWLCYVDRHAEAGEVIARLQAQPEDAGSVKEELQNIINTIVEEKASGKVGWREVFSNGEQQNFRRICLGAGTSLFQQMGGINIVVYYLPVILIKSFGFSGRLALILTAIDFMSLCFWGLMIFFVIDRVGRKKLMLYGALGMSLCFALAAVGLGIGTKASNGSAVAFIFFYNVCFVGFPELTGSFSD
jgi:sugar porter (SP) family MFS transporter